LAFFGLGTGITPTGADVTTADAVDAIARQTLRLVCARNAIVLLAYAGAVARATPTFIVGILIVGNRATNAIDAAALFGRGARLARAETPAIATDAVGAKARLTHRRRCAGRSIGSCRLRTRVTRASAITFTGIAFAVNIDPGFDEAANAIRTTAFFRRRTC
jgi:hypothetical protein